MVRRKGFELSVHDHPTVAPNTGEVDVTFSITAHGAGDDPDLGIAHVIVLDCSISMFRPSKFLEAKRAAAALIDALPDGTSFCVIGGSEHTWPLYPAEPGFVRAGESSRGDAREAVFGAEAKGGKRISGWLGRAARLFEADPPELRHVVLVTDGRNSERDGAMLAQTVGELRGTLICDCRGVGADRNDEVLRGIAGPLRGSAKPAEPGAAAVTDYQDITKAAAEALTWEEVVLRLQTPVGASIEWVRELSPVARVLSSTESSPDERRAEYPLGSWGDETRVYLVRITLPADDLRSTMLACRAAIRAGTGEEPMATAKILVSWKDDLLDAVPATPPVSGL